MEPKKRGRPRGRPTGLVRVDAELKDAFQKLSEASGLTLTGLINATVAQRLGTPWPPSENSQS